jgi:acyl carrier protein
MGSDLSGAAADDRVLTDIREFVAKHTGGAQLDDGTDIFATGYVSSLFAVQILTWVERTYDLPVAGDELDIKNFQSIEAIARFVAGKRTRTSAGS